MDNLIVKISDSQNCFTLKPVYSDRRGNLNIFSFKYTPISYTEHVVVPMVDEKIISMPSKKFSPIASPTLCQLIVKGYCSIKLNNLKILENEIIQTGNLAKFTVDYTQLTKNQDFLNLPTNELKQCFNIYGVYATDQSEIVPLTNMTIEFKCEGIICGGFDCKKSGIYYINATFNNMPILNSPRKIIATDYSSIEVVNCPQNIPFIKELYKFEIKNQTTNLVSSFSFSPDHFKVAFEGYEFMLAQIQVENDKLYGKIVFECSGPYQMKVFYDDELCFIDKNIYIYPEIYIDGFSYDKIILINQENIISINKRPGIKIKTVEIKSINGKNVDFEIVHKSNIHIDIYFTIKISGRYYFDIYFESDNSQRNECWYFDAIQSFLHPYVKLFCYIFFID